MTYLEPLGTKLRQARKRYYPADDLRAFSLRVSISRSTYHKMEKGDLSVSLEKYYRVATFLGLESTFDGLFFRYTLLKKMTVAMAMLIFFASSNEKITSSKVSII